MQLINPNTGQIIEPGAKIHTLHGAHAWRYERLRQIDAHTHHVHCTRVVKGTRGRTFRGHREFHPSVFGLEIKIDITWQRHALNKSRHVLGKVDDYLLAGLFAIVPLAFFERFHWADDITSLFTLGYIGSGH